MNRHMQHKAFQLKVTYTCYLVWLTFYYPNFILKVAANESPSFPTEPAVYTALRVFLGHLHTNRGELVTFAQRCSGPQ